MKTPLFWSTLCSLISYLTLSTLNPAVAALQPSAGNWTHFCGVIDGQWDQRHSDQYPNRRYARTFAANLNVGDPRTVRMIYFLPNDRPYRADVVQRMKDEILSIQAFYAEQMEAHGYRNTTFRVETDTQGEPIVHRVDGLHPDKHYIEYTEDTVRAEVYPPFDIEQNVYFIVIDNSIDGIGRGENRYGGIGGRTGKNGGDMLVSGGFRWGAAAHELGHAFGLQHDFRDGAYIMSYGPGWNRLSACHAEYLSVHPYFNLNTPTEERERPTIELISPRLYPAGSQSVPVRLKVNDSDGLHQLLLYVTSIEPHSAAGFYEVKVCRGLGGDRDTVVLFDYDGVIPSDDSASLSNPVVHPMSVEVVDTDGNVGRTHFVLFSEALEPLTKISGDNLQGLPNTPLPMPFVVELRDLNDGFPRYEVWVTFTVTAGGGTLGVTRTMTDENGRAESTYTLGPNLGTNIVSVSAAGIEQPVTFNAVAGPAVDIPDSNLRAVIETTLGKASGAPIAASDMTTLTRLVAENANISDLTGLEHATNLTDLFLGDTHVEGEGWINSNSIKDLSPLAGLTNLTRLNLSQNNITDLSPLSEMATLTDLVAKNANISDLTGLEFATNLTFLWLENNNITDISSVTGLTKLTRLDFGNNFIADISPVAGLDNLTSLWLWDNSISDISSVTGLTNLTKLGLWGNSISDISPLVANIGLGSGDTVYVQNNPLSYQSIHTHIPALQSRGVTVEFDNRAYPALLKIAGDNQHGASFVSLSQPFIVEAQDASGSALTGISVTFTVTAGGGSLSATITRTDTNGRAQSTLILGPNLGINTVEVSAARIESPATFYAIADTELPPMTADVNSDGNVNVLDLILIASKLGNAGANLVADVNGDGVVSILDLILAAGMFDSAAAAPSAHPQDPETFTAVEVQGWLTGARSLEVRDPIMKRGIMMLEQLLVSLTPRETELLANYPNPFNPETWIPYRLAEDANVTLTIYDSSGQVVRTLDVGHRIAAIYENRSKAIHWDGRNNVGERVASGIYFYILTTGDFSATRRMVILK